MKHFHYICPDTVTPTIRFLRDLFSCGKYTLGLSEIYNNVVTVKTLHNSVYDFTFSTNKTRINSIPFRVFHFLYNDLFSRLCGYASKSGCIHFCAQAVTYFAFRIQLAPFFKAYLYVRFCNLFSHIFKLEYFNFTGCVIVLNFNIYLGPKLFSRGRFQSLLKCFDKHLAVNALVSTNLFNDTFYICYKHTSFPVILNINCCPN